MRQEQEEQRRRRRLSRLTSIKYSMIFVLLPFMLESVSSFTTSCSVIPSYHSSNSLFQPFSSNTRCHPLSAAIGNNKKNDAGVVVVSGIESTPNPSSFIIKLESILPGLEDLGSSLRGKTYSSSQRTSTTVPETIHSILEIDGIDSVFAMATVLTINKKSSAPWERLLPLVLQCLLGNDDEKVQQILGLLEKSSAQTTTATTTTTGGQVRIRIQTSNKIPIQIEGKGSLGTVQRLKLAPKFQEAMEELQRQNPKIDFFKTRIWTDRGIRYLPEEESLPEDEEERERQELQIVLQTEAEEADAAYPSQRLKTIIEGKNSLQTQKQKQKQTSTKQEEEETSPPKSMDLEAVDRYCDLAETGDLEALKLLIKFVEGHNQGSLPARRNALAFLGGTGGDFPKKDIVFYAVVSALQNERSAMMRRTAGDALSDLGDDRAVSYAITSLEEDRSKLVQWRAARIIGELATEPDVVAVLKQLSFDDKYAFEVAFEIKDALRKVRARSTKNANTDIPNTGPMWKQIQEGMSSSKNSTTEDAAQE